MMTTSLTTNHFSRASPARKSSVDKATVASEQSHVTAAERAGAAWYFSGLQLDDKIILSSAGKKAAMQTFIREDARRDVKDISARRLALGEIGVTIERSISKSIRLEERLLANKHALQIADRETVKNTPAPETPEAAKECDALVREYHKTERLLRGAYVSRSALRRRADQMRDRSISGRLFLHLEIVGSRQITPALNFITPVIDRFDRTPSGA